MTGEFKAQHNSEQNNDTIFQDAINALRRGDKPRAKELLTLLLKTDQNNPTYWIWLSASVDATKERIYCLQTALKLDPENSTAKRGLILLGALSPDETIQPFPMNRPRAWEEKLLLAHEKPKERGLRVALRNPVLRLGGLTAIGVGMCAIIYFGVILPRFGAIERAPTNTPGPSPTFTATPTIFGATAIPTEVFSGPTPLSSFLNATYTPTPLYVNTPRSAAAVDQFRIAQKAYEDGDWDIFIENMLLLKPIEPDAADIPFLIGEAYRFKGEIGLALESYNEAIDMDPNFAAPYLGLARVRLMADPDAKVGPLFAQAIDLDPNFGEAYLDRARWLIRRGDFADSFADLELAEKLLPGSPEVYLAYATAYLGDGDKENALEYARKAYSADILNMSTYKMLGDLYLDQEDYVNAVEALRLYTTYQTEDATGFGKLGQAYFFLGEYQNTVNAINSGELINRNGMKNYLIYRGLANVELGNFKDAEGDLNAAVEEEPESFEARLGYAKALYGVGKFGSAFLQAESMRSIADTDEEKALELYWRARIQEQRNDIRDAIKSWQDLLKLDEEVMTPEMRNEARKQLTTLVPPTITLTPSRTPKGGASTSTPTPATGTPKPGASPTVSGTSKTPSATSTP
ncbi:MAG: tetratricopeptide repeat protein [Anaerolineales bacterium]|nr:tetratricopeptide repeat protein [Anaerolineales bacterium]